MKKFKKSMILGKFLPVHFGHCYMIESAMAFSEVTYLMVYTMDSEPIPGELRAHALEEHFKKDIKDGRLKILWIDQPMPQTPEEHPNFWNIWKDDIQKRIGRHIDCVFGSEDYIRQLRKVLGAKECCIVDIGRKIVPTSGTACRTNPIEEWDYIIPEMRHYFVKKIAIVGGESTGKSTLTKTMAQVFRTVYQEEYGRTYCTLKDPATFDTEDFTNIALNHLGSEMPLTKKANKVLFCDTESIVTQSFHKMMLGEYSEKLDSIIKKVNYDHYFLLSPNIEFDQDGTRLFETRGKEHFEIIKNLLDKYKRSYTVIEEPDFFKRVELVKKLTNQLLQ